MIRKRVTEWEQYNIKRDKRTHTIQEIVAVTIYNLSSEVMNFEMAKRTGLIKKKKTKRDGSDLQIKKQTFSIILILLYYVRLNMGQLVKQRAKP